MHNAIRNILDTIPSGHSFDSHYVISQLIKHHSDTYLNFASSINSLNNKTLPIHGQIGKEIKKHKNIVKQISDKAWSANIHGNGSSCACWQKL